MSDSEEEALDRQLKVVLLGDSCVGKSSLAARYCHNSFSKQYFPTSGVDFLLKRDVIQKTRNIAVQIWDVGGETPKLLDKYIYNANIIGIVYDVTNELTFINIPRWIKVIRDQATTTGNPPTLAIIGNKTDMEHQRVVKEDRQKKLAEELRVASHYTSARTGEGVPLAFQRMISSFLGIRLTRSQVEEFNPVVKAEISTHAEFPAPAAAASSHSSSSICTLQ